MIFLTLFIKFCLSFDPSNNPLYYKQYYIFNDGKIFNGIVNEDLAIKNAWNNNYTGKGVNIIIVNDGCQANHSELKDNFNSNYSYNYETETNDPSYDPRQFITSTGTKLATIAAGSNNSICGIGIAFDSEISCVNVLSSQKAMMQLDVGIKLDRHVNRSIRVIPTYSSFYSNSFIISEFRPLEETYFASLAPVYVTSIPNGVVKANEDLNYIYYNGNPYIFTFSEVSQRGGRILTSPRGNVVLASVVTGGSDYESDASTLSAYISTGDGFGGTCSETILPNGKGGAIAAGVISLIMSATTEVLEKNDIAAIIALTSIQNDHLSKSWKTNSNEIRYSPVYGFGRLNAGLATQMAKTYKHRTKEPDEVSTFNGPISIPSFLSGFRDVQLHFVNSSINYIDFIELVLEFSKDRSDYSLFRIFIISPSGTGRMVKDIATIIEPANHKYRISVRDFFGEKANGTWTVRFLRENVGPEDYKLNSVQLIITGYNEDLYKKQPIQYGHNPFSPYDHNIATVSISGHGKGKKDVQIKCGLPFAYVINSSSEYEQVPFDLVLLQNNGKGPFERFAVSNANQVGYSKIPCLYKSGTYRMRAVNPVYAGCSEDVNIELINEGTEIGFSENDQYRKITISEDSVTLIPINIRNNKTIFSNYKMGSLGLATLWNYETNTIYDTQIVTLFDGYYVYAINEPCHKCILTVVPLELDRYDDDFTNPCNTFVNVLSIIQPQENVSSFTIDWKDVCPLPKGILTPTPEPVPPFTFSQSSTLDFSFEPSETFTIPPTPSNPSSSVNSKVIIIVVSACVGLALIIFIIFWQVRKRIGIKKSKIEDTLGTTLLEDESGKPEPNLTN